MTGCRKYLLIFIYLIPGITFSAPHYYGASLSLPFITKEPSPMHGFQVMLNYDPEIYQWRKFNVYFDAGYSHFYVDHVPNYTTVSIYSVAPVVRYSFNKHGPLLPYIELSVGFAYLNHTRFENRNLGIHFAFQDRAGFGTFFGQGEHLYMGINFLHYSNAHLSEHNSGITVPATFNIGYRFS